MESDTAEARRALLENHEEYREMPKEMIEEIFPSIDTDFKTIRSDGQYVKNRFGEEFYVMSFSPEGSDGKNKVKSVIFFIHGYGSHISYNTLTILRILCKKGHTVIAMDGYGHGRSDGLHVYIPDFEKYSKDYSEIYERFAIEYPQAKKTLISSSMGGAVSIEILRNDKNKIYSGAILVSPLIELPPRSYPNFMLMGALKVLSYFFPEQKLVPSSNDSNEFYKNQKLTDLISKNPLFYHYNPRLKTSLEVINFIGRLKSFYIEITTPILVLHGADDRVTCPDASKSFVEKISSTDKEFKTYEGEKHGLFFDCKAEEVMGDILNWLEKRSY